MNTTRTLLPVCAALCTVGVLASLPALLEVQRAGAQDAPPPGGGAAQPREPAQDSYMVRDGDTLWDLSGTYMGSSYEWPRLWSYNPEITNPHWIYPGHILRLKEGADGGYTPAGMAAEGGPTAQARFGSGFGAMFNKDARWKGNTVLIGDEVYLDKDALTQAGIIAGSFEEQMFLSPSDQVYIEFKKGGAPAVGKELTVFIRLHRMEVKPSAGKVRTYDPGDEGEIVRVLGAVRIESYDDKTRIAKATIVSARDPIERGFEVTDVPSRLAVVPAKTNDQKVEAQVVAATRPLGILSAGQLVFVNAGEKKGVQPGNRFFVVRRGDEWRKHLTLREDLSGAERPDPSPIDDDKLPWEVVAELLVLYVRPHSCTTLITASTAQVEPGDKVEMREGY
jgi:hypothetical protein